MDLSGVIIEKFIKCLTTADLESDEMKLPAKIISKYGDIIPKCLLLKFLNGYQIPVMRNEEKGTLSGLSTVYADFDLKAGEMLVFQFDGSSNFNVYVIGTDLLEIEYPCVVHHFQRTPPRNVNVAKVGLKFLNFVNDSDPIIDDYEPPHAIKKRFPMLKAYQNYFFSNGKSIEGGYDHETGKFHGLSKFSSIFGMQDFSRFNLLLFHYEDSGITTISVFDDHFVEYLFPGTPISSGLNAHNPIVRYRFEITVKAHHLYKYVYGVDISTDYSIVTAFWKKRDYINVYLGEKAWKLQVRYRGANSNRTTIHDGWIQFRDGLGLQLGDVVVFECADPFRTHFAVRVLRNHGA
ncbi:hypothetical protein DCAR_0310034 [Daucus carota subsp. sativus]|uniref:TF-B3 domain-containing protein n=1 Tax=Daucus carota subsp. sativus TaxID=79200 RepID=A0AAF0WKJ5_DAUCS|nr:PREDICTED: uncharacterized protein LOC108213909 [Daucus carota subsp. sativus]WOG90789.1 hypothetical protein DCAR_0310034 [Daucus carota subsp. sativus]